MWKFVIDGKFRFEILSLIESSDFTFYDRSKAQIQKYDTDRMIRIGILWPIESFNQNIVINFPSNKSSGFEIFSSLETSNLKFYQRSKAQIWNFIIYQKIRFPTLSSIESSILKFLSSIESSDLKFVTDWKIRIGILSSIEN